MTVEALGRRVYGLAILLTCALALYLLGGSLDRMIPDDILVMTGGDNTEFALSLQRVFRIAGFAGFSVTIALFAALIRWPVWWGGFLILSAGLTWTLFAVACVVLGDRLTDNLTPLVLGLLMITLGGGYLVAYRAQTRRRRKIR